MTGAGVSLAGIALGMSGVVPGYALVWTLLFASGLGVAMFHPAAGKAARYAAMEGAGEVRKLYVEASAMSIFATGGNVGFSWPRYSRRPRWTRWVWARPCCSSRARS
jgi:FSR family fosmidomycin resistance protein-like MFS transporter